MLTDNKKIFIKVRKLNSAYAKANSARLNEVQINRTIGAAVTSCNKMIANSEEQASIMGDIIAISPNSSDWNKELKRYWDGFTYDIPENGKELEIGFIYDINAINKQVYINNINSSITIEKNKLRSDEDLKNYIDDRIKLIIKSFNKTMSTVANIKDAVQQQRVQDNAYKVKFDNLQIVESERFKVGRPIEAFDYMLYRYAMVYGDVANEQSLVSKSPKIRFYLHSADDIKKEKRLKSKTNFNKIKLLVKVLDSVESMTNLLYAMGEGNNIPTDNEDLYDMIEKISVSRESEFITIANNPDLQVLGSIEKYINSGILTRAHGSQIVYNATDNETPIGNTMEEVIKYFKNQANKAVISEFKTKYNNLAI